MSARTLLVWCPDWPVIAAEIVEGVPASGPVVVLHGNRVLACSGPPARTAYGGGYGGGRRRPAARS
jgi:protein ImuB